MVSDEITKMVVLAESSPILPSELALRAYELSTDAVVKETCYGLIVTGSEQAVNETIEELRKLDPSGIFVKDRGLLGGAVHDQASTSSRRNLRFFRAYRMD